MKTLFCIPEMRAKQRSLLYFIYFISAVIYNYHLVLLLLREFMYFACYLTHWFW